jgi:hypothetical protein
MFIWPLQHVYQNFQDTGKLFWGREIMRAGWKKIFREVHLHGIPNTTLTIDFHWFDKKLLFELMRDKDDIWRSYYDFSQYEPTSFYPWGRNDTDPERIERLWKWKCHSTKHTPILLPDGRLYKWRHSGFGSGYQETQLNDTFCNAIMLSTCLSDLGVDIENERFWLMLQGDDSLVTFQERMFQLYGQNFLRMFDECARFRFNAEVNTKPGKSKILGELNGQKVLGYFTQGGIPYRLDIDLLSHLVFPETLPQSENKLMASAIGLAMASCGCSRKFYDLCAHIVDALKSRGFSPNFNQLEWMVTIGLYYDLEELRALGLPSFEELQTNNFEAHERTERDKQRVWPTMPTDQSRFYFLLV